MQDSLNTHSNITHITTVNAAAEITDNNCDNKSIVFSASAAGSHMLVSAIWLHSFQDTSPGIHILSPGLL